MEEINNSVKVTYAKSLNKISFNLLSSTPIDANVNIKNIIDINTYVYDTKAECGNAKAILNGKLGIKVLYVDTDNITNTITNSITFNETITDSTITSDCFLNLGNASTINSVLSADGILKINCEVNFTPVAYLNLPIKTQLDSENMIVKKKEISCNCICQNISTNFDYSINFETKDVVSKILSVNTYYTNTNATSFDGYMVVEGKLFATIIFESLENDEVVVKQLSDCFNIKCDVPVDNLEKDNFLDLSFALNKFKETVANEKEDDNTVISISNNICVCGIASKNISLDLIDDMYNLDNEISLNYSTREYIKNPTSYCVEELVGNDITLNNDETAIDNLIDNINILPEITNTYIKDNTLFVEGVVSSNALYIDENKELKQKYLELPFVVNTKIKTNTLPVLHSSVCIEDCKTKVKRGTIIEIEYILSLSLCVYEKDSVEIVDDISLGKPLDFSDYDYQIYLSNPNENLWDLCKRTKTTPENLSKYNKNLPLVLTGKEKIIVKR